MFGKAQIYEIIRGKSSLSADQILDAIINARYDFQRGFKGEDDIPLVIIKTTD